LKLIGDQRRSAQRAAIESMEENPNLAKKQSPWSLSVEDLDRMQQMFSDLNRTARKRRSRSNILYNHRDLMSQVTWRSSSESTNSRGSSIKDRISLRCDPKLFILGAAIYDATTAFLGTASEPDFDDKKVTLPCEFWESVAGITRMGKVKANDLKPFEVRRIHSQRTP